MEKGDLSYETLGPRKRRIDVAELERWNGGLKNRSERQTSEDVKLDVGSGYQKTSESDKDLIAENATLKERLSQIESKRADEKSGFEDQIDFLKARIEKMDSAQTQMTALLEDHREGRSRAEVRADEVLTKLEKAETKADEVETKLGKEVEKFKAAYVSKRREYDQREEVFEEAFEEAIKQAWSLGGLMRKLTGKPAVDKKRVLPKKQASEGLKRKTA